MFSKPGQRGQNLCERQGRRTRGKPKRWFLRYGRALRLWIVSSTRWQTSKKRWEFKIGRPAGNRATRWARRWPRRCGAWRRRSRSWCTGTPPSRRSPSSGASSTGLSGEQKRTKATHKTRPIGRLALPTGKLLHLIKHIPEKLLISSWKVFWWSVTFSGNLQIFHMIF